MPAAWLIGVPTALLAAFTLTPLLNHQHWTMRFTEFPRIQVAWITVALIGCALVWLPAGPLRLGILAVNAAVLAWQLYRTLPYTRLWPKAVRAAPGDASPDARLRILVANVLTPNRRADALLARVREYRPHILLALETDHWWENQLEPLAAEYPHVVRCPLDNLYGLHLYSRLPLFEPRIQYLVESDVPSVHTAVELPDGRRVWLHGVHPSPPSPTENETSAERDAELTLVGRRVADAAHPVIVTGDLNDVAWSHTTRLFQRISGLLDPRIGRGLYCSFHAQWPLLRWPLDHLFHSSHFTLADLRLLPEIGSDHFPVLFELVLEESHAPNEELPEREPGDRAQADENLEVTGTEADDVHVPDVDPAPGR